VPVEEVQTAAHAEVAPLLSGALVTASEERDAERDRRLGEHRLQVRESLRGLPLLDPLIRFEDRTPEEALQVLKGGTYPVTHGGVTVALEVPFSYRDAETMGSVAATCAVTYEPANHQVTREALEIYLFSLRKEPLTAPHAANLIGHALWAYMFPMKLKVTVKPGVLREKGAFSHDRDDDLAHFTLEEEVLRQALALKVPGLIERAQAKGGPTALEREKAGEVVLDMVASVRSGAYAITGPDSILPAFLQAVAAAAFLPRGVDCMGLHFEAEIPHGAFAQTDFEDYARAKSDERMIPLSVAKNAVEKAVKFALDRQADQDEDDDDLTIGEDGKIRVSAATLVEAAAQAREDEATKLRAKHGDDELAHKLADALDAEAAQVREEGQAQFGASKFTRGWDKEV